MQAGYLVQALLRHTFDAGICRVGGQRKIGLFEPMAECFGMNAEQTSAVCDRKRSHDRVSFREETKRQTRETRVAGNFPELRHFQEISWKFGRKSDEQQTSVGNGEEARISQQITTTFGVVIAGMTLMAATPPRPGQNPTGR